MDNLQLSSALENSQRVLVAGAGGGFDVYAGLPIYERLRRLGKHVFLANLSFTLLQGTDARMLTRALRAVEPTTSGADVYFPERALAQFLSRSEEPVTVYAFEKLGVAPVREAYSYLVESLNLDAVVLVDGGTDLAATIIRPVFWITVVCAVWWSFLPCPRCGAKFSGWWGSEYAWSPTLLLRHQFLAIAGRSSGYPSIPKNS